MIGTLKEGASVEVIRAADQSLGEYASLQKGLIRLGMLNSSEDLLSFKDREGWYRGGSESYCATFEFTAGTHGKKRCVVVLVKAIVSLVHPDYIWRQWVRRIGRLSDFGVRTPRIFSYWRGLIFQEFVPFDLSCYLSSMPLEDVSHLTRQHQAVRAALERAGFLVTGLDHNLRTDGKTIYLVDFGEDIGSFKTELNVKSPRRDQKTSRLD